MIVNEYCLLHIFSYLDLKDQHQVYLVNEYFQNLITRLWRSKYNTTFCFNEEKDHLKLLHDDDAMFDILKEIAKQTKSLLNIPSRFINLLQAKTKETYTNVEVLSIRYYTKDDEDGRSELPLKQLPDMCPNLVSLDLVWFELLNVDPDIFVRIKPLVMLTLIPSIGNANSQMELIRSVTYCNTLQHLRISVTLLSSGCDEIVQMKSLRILQLYQVPSENELMEKTLENVFIATRSANRQIIGLYIKSDLGRLPVTNLLIEQSRDFIIEITNMDANEEKKKLLILKNFSWEPRIRLLNYNNHTLLWRVIHPKVKEFVIKFLRNSDDLKVIDLSHNRHFSNNEIALLQLQRPNVKIYHNTRYDSSIMPFSFADIQIDEETITFEFLQEN